MFQQILLEHIRFSRWRCLRCASFFLISHFDSSNIYAEAFYCVDVIKYYFDVVKIFKNASCGIETLPICFIRFFPSFCLSKSLRFLVISPP